MVVHDPGAVPGQKVERFRMIDPHADLIQNPQDRVVNSLDLTIIQDPELWLAVRK